MRKEGFIEEEKDKRATAAQVTAAAPVGYIDSVYCGSGVDGNGLRCVVFFAGCNLRCPFCHNPETLFKQGTMTDINSLVSRLERYKGYFRRGGVTLSGGEPFLQKSFALALVSALHAKGIRCCFETNGHIADAELIGAAEYLIVDVKNQESDDLAPYEKFFAECVRQDKEVRVTNVLVPGKNDGEEKLRALAALVKKYFPGEPPSTSNSSRSASCARRSMPNCPFRSRTPVSASANGMILKRRIKSCKIYKKADFLKYYVRHKSS